MSRFKAPSKGDRHDRSHGTPIGIAHRGPEEVAPPALRPGQVRCPACRNGVTPTTTGALRRHRDLFGADCWNTTPADMAPVKVALPPMETLRLLPSTNEVPPDGACQQCSKPVPPMRRLCGACMSRRRT
jgi:hypothetical protein